MRKYFAFILLSIIIIFFSLKPAQATTLDDCNQNPIPSDKAADCIEIITQKVSDLGSQKKTLATQIAQFDSQIQLTQLKIVDAQATVEKLEKEIGVLGFRIGYINESVDRLETLLKERIIATYQQGFVSNLEILVTSRDFSDLILRTQYLKQVQENDKKILSNLQQTKANYAGQKDERETKQAAIEDSKKKLEDLKVKIDSEKLQKQSLLVVTKNDEAKYQKLLAQAQAELAVSFGGGDESFIRDVSQGEAIGSIASISTSAGCSSGAHLHFEVHKNGSIQDPNNYLQPTSVQYPNNYDFEVYGRVNPQGNLPWPINSPIQINQGFGVQKNSFIYGPAGHTGIDMQTGSGNASGNAVKSIKSGKLYGGAYRCGKPFPGSLVYARVKHDDSTESLYLHMIPH